MYLISEAVYVLSRNGNPVIQLGQYRYRRWTGSKGSKVRWICNSNNKEAVFLLSRNGNPVIQLGQYRFNRWSRSKGPKVRWICTANHKGCRAKIMTVDEVIVKYMSEHNH
ncbi:unnamed protein product [Euphydryas editha]|uniref:FLYWCH-type domain-containing protein n=1 Tax=Euphydryas editha TaxID=104508 RepID=A0AAU9TIC4_EUPED|nr:unnamed protein product [Euphydryas editha]